MVTFQMHSWGRLAPSVITFLAGPTDSMLISPGEGALVPEKGAGGGFCLQPAPSPPLPQMGQKPVRCPGGHQRSGRRVRTENGLRSPLPCLGHPAWPLGSTSVPVWGVCPARLAQPQSPGAAVPSFLQAGAGIGPRHLWTEFSWGRQPLRAADRGRGCGLCRELLPFRETGRRVWSRRPREGGKLPSRGDKERSAVRLSWPRGARKGPEREGAPGGLPVARMRPVGFATEWLLAGQEAEPRPLRPRSLSSGTECGLEGNLLGWGEGRGRGNRCSRVGSGG